VEDEDVEAAEDVGEGHEGDEDAADTGDALDAPEDHHRGEDGEKKAGHPAGDLEGAQGEGGDRVGLHHAADTKGGNGGECGKEDAHPAPAQSAFEHIHRPPCHIPARGLDAVFDRQQPLGVLGADAENPGEPEPQHRPGPAKGDRGRHPDDVAGADGRGQGCGQGAELADIPLRACIPGEGEFDCLENVALGEAQPDGEKKMGAEKEENQRQAPEKTVQSGDDIGYHLHGYLTDGVRIGCMLCTFFCAPRPAERSTRSPLAGKPPGGGSSDGNNEAA